MDIYQKKSAWKWYLAIGALLIVIISGVYTRYLANQLEIEEVQKAQQFAEAMRSLTNEDTTQNFCDMALQLRIMNDNTTIPVIILDEAYHIQDSRNLTNNPLEELDTLQVRRALQKMILQGADTIPFETRYSKQYLIYSHSRFLTLIQWYPAVQLVLVAMFIAFGYYAFSTARRAEQNRVWVGMAKETAHQLGTPISAIVGWIENLRAMNEEQPDNIDMIEELRNDVTRLELIADRFSKIGSQPELVPHNVFAVLDENKQYMARRAPRRVAFDFPEPANQPNLTVMVNAHLFDWVLENLLRNAIDAIEEGKGAISAHVYEEVGFICIDISDTGKGIPANKFNTIFKPGYSTKTRGWGLGLSLSKRIIEEYHNGKIFVKKSEIGKGTTFTIKLPIDKKNRSR